MKPKFHFQWFWSFLNHSWFFSSRRIEPKILNSECHMWAFDVFAAFDARLPSCTSFGISILLPHQTMKLWALDVFPSPMSQTLATVLPQTSVVLGLSQQKAGDRNWSRHHPWTPLTGLLSCFPTQPWTTCTKVASRLMNCALPYPSKQCPTNLP